ncbi:MAG: hypothetical protein K6G80_00930 [Treponema sp.]|nr:hypothetical protein [Treponema sp.]
MKLPVESLINHFLRTYLSPFTAKDVCRMLTGVGVKASEEEIKDYLEFESLVFPLEKNLYITRAGAFTGYFFSFVPTAQEVNAQVFVAGDRCIPFVDAEVLSCALQFEYNGRMLPPENFSTDCNTARDLFSFFGDEYASQYIAADPLNKELNLASCEFELPSEVKLTGVSMKRIFKDCDFKYGDRFLCRVRDWNKGIIELFPLVAHRRNPFEMDSEDIERQHWNDVLEKALLESFDRMGPCSCIEEQLANVFYEKRRELCRSSCGSIHEFLNSARKVSMELFGVETRLWRHGESVPAVGKWNRGSLDAGSDGGVPVFELPDFVIDCFIHDQLYEKKDDVEALVNRMIPESMPITADERELFTLQIIHRNAILRKKYNWFADYHFGSIRHRALELYSQVGELVCEVDTASAELERLPQQELVTLSQLFTHVSRILEMIASDSDSAVNDTNAIQSSLEGMEYNFEDIRSQLLAAVEKIRINRFEVI